MAEPPPPLPSPPTSEHAQPTAAAAEAAATVPPQSPAKHHLRQRRTHRAPPDRPRVPADAPSIVQCAFRGDGAGLAQLLADAAHLPGAADAAAPATGLTGLHAACMRGQIPALELLLGAAARADARDKLDNTPLHYAAYYAHYHTARTLLRRAPQAARVANKRNEAGMTPLFIAAVRGDARLCECLLAHGADPALAAIHNRTALHEAALAGSARAAETLHAAGADVNARDSDQRTPLHYAVLGAAGERAARDVVAVLTAPPPSQLQQQQQQQQQQKKLLPNLSAADRHGLTPLHYAVLRGYDSLIGLFTSVNDGCNISIVYELRQRMAEGGAATPRMPPLPIPIVVPACFPATGGRPRAESVMFLIREGQPLPEGVLPDEVSPLPDPAPAAAAAAAVEVEKSLQAEPVFPATNRYGFVVSSPLTAAEEWTRKRREREVRGALKWSLLLKDWPKLQRDRDKLRRKCAKGIPESVRGEVWKLLAEVPGLRHKHPSTYQSHLAVLPPAKVALQIDLDIRRSHLEHELFAQPFGRGQISLFNVMRAYANHDKVVGYTQGMSDVCGFLLMYMPEEDAFWMMVQLMFDPRWAMQGLFMDGFPYLHKVHHVYLRLVKKYHPDIAAHMHKVELPEDVPMSYEMEWFMVVFTRVLPFEITLRIFDIILCRGYKKIFSFALAILHFMRDTLFAIDNAPVLMQQLKNPVACLGKVSPDDFIAVATKHYDVPQKTVDALMAEYDALNHPTPVR